MTLGGRERVKGVVAGGGGGFALYMWTTKFREVMWVTQAHTAGLAQPGVAPRSWTPSTMSFLPTAAAFCLCSSSG